MVETLETLREIRALTPAGSYDHERKLSGRCHAPAIKAWKEKGGKVLGFQCVFAPEEIIHAAGLLPARVWGGAREMTSLEAADAYLYHNSCSFMRANLTLVLDGHFDFMDGFVGSPNCDCSKRFCQVVDYYKFFPFIHQIDVPHQFDERALGAYRREVQAFVDALENHFKVKVTDEALQESIKVYRRTGELFHKLYELRKQDNPPITGAEVLEVHNAMHMMPREDFNQFLECLVEEASNTDRGLGGRVRILFNGSPLNNPDFMKCIEDQGALIVAEDLCTTTRYWWDPVEPQPGEGLMDAITRRYLNNEHCARAVPADARREQVLERAREWHVDGVISEMIAFCVPYVEDQPLLRRALQKEDIPVLELDVEYGMGKVGQVTTRAQAFIEMIREKNRS